MFTDFGGGPVSIADSKAAVRLQPKDCVIEQELSRNHRRKSKTLHGAKIGSANMKRGTEFFTAEQFF